MPPILYDVSAYLCHVFYVMQISCLLVQVMHFMDIHFGFLGIASQFCLIHCQKRRTAKEGQVAPNNYFLFAGVHAGEWKV